jgi:lipopolysaccharide assembly outer membrane protein LptD (OstA)
MTKMRGTSVLVAVAIAGVVCASVLWAQAIQKNAPSDPKAAESKSAEIVTYQAKLMKAMWGDRTKVILTGGVKFTHGDTILTCEEIQYDREENTAVSPGKVSVSDPQCEITAEKGAVYFKKRLGVLEGNVVMLIKPRQEEDRANVQAREDKESIRAKFSKPTTVTCSKLEYDYRSKVATASGGVTLRQERRTVTAEKLIYDDKNQLVTLIGNVKGVDEEGQTFQSPDKVVICIKKGSEWMEAPNATATFKVEVEEQPSRK